MLAVLLLLAAAVAAGQQPPAPKPFPQPGAPRAPEPPPRPAPSAPVPPPAATAPLQPEARPSDGQLGVPVYPGAQFLASYPAGRGQRFFLFGAAASFIDVVGFYRSVLKQKGELIFDAPATQEFDVGRFREETMAFPPGVTIKDFQSQISQGFPNPKPGGQPARFPTVIQIVPVPSER